MASARRRFWKRIFPRGLRSGARRMRGTLLRQKHPLEHTQREDWFHDAFRALRFNGITGDYAEFGCHGGRTFSAAYHAAKRNRHDARLWAFDSFQGLPAPKDGFDEHRWWKEGKMSTSLDEFHAVCAAEGVPRDRYETVPGFYEDSLEAMAPGDGPTDIALAYVDCDLYSSTCSVLRFLAPRLKHGMILAFDDYYCWSPTQVAGERRALLDFLAAQERWNLLPYRGIGWHGASFVVEDRATLEGGGQPPA